MPAIYERTHKARVFIPDRPLQPSLIFQMKAMSLQQKGALLGRLQPYLQTSN